MLYNKNWDKPEIKADDEIVCALLRAREIISDPTKWTCGSYARTKNGRIIGPLEEPAVSFCSVGALAIAIGGVPSDVEFSPAHDFLKMAASEKGHSDPTRLNDQDGYAAALAMFDRAIELARSPQEIGNV